ncbi:MAG: hypothetical protein P9L96_05930 [Candidatus Gygaella obscura]|nr:hypothetical protein [Candidatus Gygaella obscura]
MEEETKLRLFAISVILNLIFVFSTIGLLVSLSKTRISKEDEIRLRIESEEQYSTIAKKKNDLELANKHLKNEVNKKERELSMLEEALAINKNSKIKAKATNDVLKSQGLDNNSPKTRD